MAHDAIYDATRHVRDIAALLNPIPAPPTAMGPTTSPLPTPPGQPDRSGGNSRGPADRLARRGHRPLFRPSAPCGTAGCSWKRRCRLLITYGRCFTHPHPYKLVDLANAEGVSTRAPISSSALSVPIIHPCWSGGMPVLVEHSAEAVASADVEAGGGGRLGDRWGQRAQWPGVGDSLVWPVGVVELLELAQRVQQVRAGSRSGSGRAARGGRSAPSAP